MPGRAPSCTADELERVTGFDRRTIAYYVQEGLLPKVGRRGPRTRYPKLVMDRLLFIRRVRESEEAGELGAVSLSEMRGIFERVAPEIIARVAGRQLSAAAALGDAGTLLQPVARRNLDSIKPPMGEGVKGQPSEPAWPDFETQSSTPVRRAVKATRGDTTMATKVFSAPAMADQTPIPRDVELSEALLELQTRARHHGRNQSSALETWSRVEISPEIALTVRGITDKDAPLLESVGRKLRRLIRNQR